MAVESAKAASSRRKSNAFPYWSVIPVLLFIALFTLYPVYTAIKESFFLNIITQPRNNPFIGLKNYTEVMTSYYFLSSLGTTSIYTLATVAGVILFGMVAALVMNTSIMLSNFLKVIILLPWAVSTVVGGLLWKWILNSDFGIFSGILYSLGFIKEYIPFLSNPVLAKISLVVAHIWKEGPLAAIFILSGLQLIPKDLYESAGLDGGNKWSMFRLVTLPLLRPILLVVLVFETVTSILSFDLVYVMTGGGPADSTALISWFAYSEIFKSLNLGHGLALSIIIAIITLALISVYLRALKTDYTIH